MSINPVAQRALPLQAVPLAELDKKNYSSSQLFQQLLDSTYLKPFDRDPNLILGEREFEILDSTIHRVTHGATHACRVASYVKVLHVFRSSLSFEPSKKLKDLSSSYHLSVSQIVHITQIAALLHDAARRGEGDDRWDDDSARLCFAFLSQLFPDLEPSLADAFSSMIRFKDDAAGYSRYLVSLKINEEQVASFNYLRELIHDADCLDVMRVRKTFKVVFLDVAKDLIYPHQHKALLALVCEIRELIHLQADMFKDHAVEHSFPLEKKIAFLEKRFSIEVKESYEHAQNVYEKVLNDMRHFAWLRTAAEPIPSEVESFVPSCAISAPTLLQSIADQLTLFNIKDCKIFYGGPVDHGLGVAWVMPVVFFDDSARVRAAFEISFINCLPTSTDLKDASLYFARISDLDLKARNTSLQEVCAFFELINNTDPDRRAILIREVDILNISYPLIYNAYLYSHRKEGDIELILNFLKKRFHILGEMTDLSGANLSSFNEKISTQHQGVIERKKVFFNLEGIDHFFFIDHYVLPKDPWQSYYVFSLVAPMGKQENELTSLRIDSGCNTGMIYLDDRCSCQSELEEGLKGLAASASGGSLLIHIPAHDGRGMGMALKAETEIYKRGGRGMLRATPPLGDRESATTLYGSEQIDIRSYDGASFIALQRGATKVRLISRSEKKKKGLENAGIFVKYA